MALKLKGSTSGFVAIDAPSVAGNNTLILPENTGSAHQILANDITAGVTTFTQITVSRNGDLTVPGTISIGGTLTYEDVTSVDSVGIVTARGLSIFGNTTGLNATGVSTFTGNVSMGGGNLILGDSGGSSDDRIQIGASQDLSLYHNGASSYIDNTGGSLFIKSSNQVYIQDDQGRKQITCVDGAAVELYHAGVDSVRLQTTTTGVSVPTLNVTGISTFIGNVSMGGGNLVFGDSGGATDDRLTFGAGTDLSIFHDGSASYIRHTTGPFYIESKSGQTAIQIVPDAATDLRYSGTRKLQTSSTGVNVEGQIIIDHTAGTDGKGEIAFGESGRPFIDGFDNGNHGSGAGFDFRAGNGHYFMKMRQGSSVELYHNNTEVIETISTGTRIPDGKFAKFGNSDDLTMGHNTYNYITYTGADLLITGDATNQIKLQPKSDEPAIVCKPNAEVELYHDATERAATASNGFTVKGNLFVARENGTTADYANMKVAFYQQISASASHTFQVGSVYAMGTVTIHGSRGPGANNATIATGKIFPIHVRAGATAGLGSQIGSDLGGASGGYSYSVAAASQGITVTNSSSTYAMKCFVTFDLTGFVG